TPRSGAAAMMGLPSAECGTRSAELSSGSGRDSNRSALRAPRFRSDLLRRRLADAVEVFFAADVEPAVGYRRRRHHSFAERVFLQQLEPLRRRLEDEAGAVFVDDVDL